MSNFDVAEAVATVSYYYQPNDYLESCEEDDVPPTEQGFLDFIRAEVHSDFPISDWVPVRIVRKDDPEAERDDSNAMSCIAKLLNGSEWSADTLDAIADIVRSTGRPVEDFTDANPGEGE